MTVKITKAKQVLSYRIIYIVKSMEYGKFMKVLTQSAVDGAQLYIQRCMGSDNLY